MPTRRAVVIALALSSASIASHAFAQDPQGSAVMQVKVRAVWVHDVPAPPQGDFWDSALTSALGIFAGRAGIYPDVVVCARPAAPGFTGRPTCTREVCTDLQGDARLGSQSTECQRGLRLDLPTGDPRMSVEVLEMNDQQVHAIIARNVLVADPSRCNDAQPCSFDVSPGKGPLVLSFSTEIAGRLGAAPPPPLPTPAARPPAPAPTPVRCQPTLQWDARDVSPVPRGLHGPYPGVDDAMLQDRAPRMAFQSTLQNQSEAEYGFLVVRDVRQPSGGYYTTPPVAGTAKASATDRPTFSLADYQTSLDRAFSTCAYIKYFEVVATVHTHPNALYPSNSFSADDFTQAIQLKTMWPAAFEKVVMINARDGNIRTFAPRVGDKPFSAFGMSVAGTIPYLSVAWLEYAWRVHIIGTFR